RAALAATALSSRPSLSLRRRPSAPLFPYTTLFRSATLRGQLAKGDEEDTLFSVIETRSRDEIRQYQNDRKSWEERLQRLEDEKRSEEHTSELQSREKLVCRLLLEKKMVSWDSNPTS